ncbi:MAG TPA: GNAT family N-acetyltransferase [Ktedonobacteraceae bacterium]|nr:GNAT family N-acetyltransferase [Ktedonobacteraceae bacterium]
MSTAFDHIEVRNNEDEQQYEVTIDGHTAILFYEREGNSITFLHTEVPPALEGHGIASTLAHTALEDARTLGLNVVPLCPFVASYIRRHPDYLSLLTEAEQARLRKRGEDQA